MKFDFNRLFGRRPAPGSTSPPPSGKGFSVKHIRNIVFVVLGILIALVLVSGCWYNVSEQEQAVVTMFGRVTGTKSAGLYFKIPILQQATLVDTTTKGMPIGYTTSTGEREAMGTVSTHEASMITSDFNFVDIDFYLEYRVNDPVAFLFASENPESILRNVAQAAIRSTVVKYTVDDVITTAKSQIQSEVRETIMEDLSELNVGLQIVNVSVQDAEPPTEAVIEAFKAVETAKQGADTAVNNAKRYQSEKIPAAEAQADRILQQAEAAKASRIAEAEGQAERFKRLYDEYAKYPLITRQRMFYETMEDVMPGLKVIVTDGTTQTMLPLESFAGTAEETDTKDGGDKE